MYNLRRKLGLIKCTNKSSQLLSQKERKKRKYEIHNGGSGISICKNLQ